MSKPKVFGVSLSPFVRKLRAYLAEKGIDYDIESVMPGSDDADFRKISPLGKVPAFSDDKVSISDSSVICAYLERENPDPPLYPNDAAAYARALWLEEWADTVLVAAAVVPFRERLLARALFNREPDEDAVTQAIENELPTAFDYLESQLSDSGHLVGDSITIADIAIATHFANLGYGGCSVDAERWPKLAAYAGDMLARPSFAALLAEEKQFVDRFAG
jgi:glutathione S-transferase